MTDAYDHLGFSAWPFWSVPNKEFAQHWFDMEETYSELNKMSSSIENKRQSSINPIWGWYGMGKTHVLMHLANKWSSQISKIIPVYMEFSLNCTSFIDLYRIFATAFLTNHGIMLKNMIESIFRSKDSDQIFTAIFSEFPDMKRALHLYYFGEQTEIVRQWFVGGNVHLRTLKQIGIEQRIDSDSSAISAITCIVNLILKYSEKIKLAWLIDECQKVSDLKPRYRSSIQEGLQVVYNKCPEGLAIIPAYSGRDPNKISYILSGALISRMGASRRVSILPMNAQHARIFIDDLFKCFRKDDFNEQPCFPFTHEAIDLVISTMNDEKWYLKPRNIMLLLERIVEEYQYDIVKGHISRIDEKQIKEVLTQIRNSSEIVNAFRRVE